MATKNTKTLMNNETPITDAKFHELNILHQVSHLLAFQKAEGFAQSLEKKLNKVQAERDQLREKGKALIAALRFDFDESFEYGKELQDAITDFEKLSIDISKEPV